MPTPVKVRAKVIADNSGVALELPTLITEHGVLGPLLDYQLTHEHDRSESWMQRLAHATYLLMRYMNANAECFSDPKRLFESFVQRLYSGTIGDDGFDPSGLYWLPTSTATTNKMIGVLTGFTDWLADQKGTTPMNPLRTADSFERRLNYAAGISGHLNGCQCLVHNRWLVPEPDTHQNRFSWSRQPVGRSSPANLFANKGLRPVYGV